MNTPAQNTGGPLKGLRIVEFSSIGPGPFACMMLSDMGADVVRIERPGAAPRDPRDIVARGRNDVRLDLKVESDVAQAMDLLEQADVLVEGFRPGVMERLGLGPEPVALRNKKLIYARMTGWGQTGPLKHVAGHDINYIALAGAMAAIGERGGAPVPPLNLVGDYGGGALYLVVGILAALHHARLSGRGQVVDAAICDGVLSLLSNNVSHRNRGLYVDQRGSNMIDGGAPFYTTYETADGGYLSVGPIEPKFWDEFCELLGLPRSVRTWKEDRSRWNDLRREIAAVVSRLPLDLWTQLFEFKDACVAPVLTVEQAMSHAQMVARENFLTMDGVTHVAPAPRFSLTPSKAKPCSSNSEQTVEEITTRWKTRH